MPSVFMRKFGRFLQETIEGRLVTRQIKAFASSSRFR